MVEIRGALSHRKRNSLPEKNLEAHSSKRKEQRRLRRRMHQTLKFSDFGFASRNEEIERSDGAGAELRRTEDSSRISDGSRKTSESLARVEQHHLAAGSRDPRSVVSAMVGLVLESTKQQR